MNKPKEPQMKMKEGSLEKLNALKKALVESGNNIRATIKSLEALVESVTDMSLTHGNELEGMIADLKEHLSGYGFGLQILADGLEEKLGIE